MSTVVVVPHGVCWSGADTAASYSHRVLFAVGVPFAALASRPGTARKAAERKPVTVL